jgi:M6 family metalloprotease-like protein
MKSPAMFGASLSRAFSLCLLAPLALGAAIATARDLRAPAPDEVIVEGVLAMLIGDPAPGSGGRSQKIFTLETDDGRSFELDFTGATLPPEGVHSLVRKRIRVRGQLPSDAAFRARGAAAPLTVKDARPMLLPAPKSSLPWGLGKATGTQPYISLLCKYSDVATEPRPSSYFITQLSNTSPGFDHYFRETSYNLLNLTGSTATATWASLGHPKSYYLDGVKTATTYLTEIFNDCVAAHNATINFAPYYGINIMLNSDLLNSAWGGGRSATIDGVAKVWPVTWMPYLGEGNSFGWRRHGVLAHEMSHAFGAPHSESPDGNEYGSEWDVVSSPGASCATVDANYGCLGQHMNAYAKTLMSNIAAARIATHNSGTQTYNIERLAQPPNAAGTYQMVRVNISGTATRWYTIESRHRTGYDAQLRGDGVVIHEIDTTRSNDARLVVPGGSTAAGYGGLAALWQPGMAFVKAADNVRIDINSFSAGGTANVTVEPYAAVTDTFPPACGIPSGWTVPAGALTGWSASTDSAAVGNCSLKSNAMADPPNDGTRVRAEIQYTGTFSAGNITFWARVSAEDNYDCLRFLIDSVQQNVGTCTLGTGLGLTPSSPSSPDTGWRFFSIPVTAGTRTVRWSYDKDYFTRGSDAAWIDSVTFPTAAASADVSLAHTVSTNPASSGRDAVFTMTAANNGPSTATGVTITATYDAAATVIWASPGCVKAGADPVYSCSVGALANGVSSQPFKLVLRKDAAGTMFNNAAVTSTTLDSNPANDSPAINVTVNASPPATSVQRYRLYSPVTLEHHFTTDLNEYTVLGGFVGTWVQEGGVGKVLNNPGTFGGVAAVPYYRLYDTSTRWHHWTTDANEYYTLSVLFPWWTGEGVDGWILPTQPPGTIQLYRLLYPFVAGLHHWTIDPTEYSILISTYGWIGEGGSGFVIP